jgi:TrmH family RNA methyltransferase
MQVLAADAGGVSLYGGADLTKPTLWIFGNEAWGIPKEVLELVDQVVSIPIYGQAESLNLATASALCLYASATAQRS